MIQAKLVMLLYYIGVYGTKEELEDAEDFFPFIYSEHFLGFVHTFLNVIRTN